MHVPFQRFSMRAEDGAPVFVDPTLFALALRLPLRDCMERGIRCGEGRAAGAARVCMCEWSWRLWEGEWGWGGGGGGDSGAGRGVCPTGPACCAALRQGLAAGWASVCRGVEFVLKTSDGKWRSWKQGHGASCNFYAELPLPMP